MVLHLLTRYLPWLNLGRIKLNLCFLFYCCFPCNLVKGKYIPLHITCLLAWLCAFLKDFLEHLEIDIFFELSSSVLCFSMQSLSYFFVISVMRRSGNRLICSSSQDLSNSSNLWDGCQFNTGAALSSTPPFISQIKAALKICSSIFIPHNESKQMH